MTYTDSPIVMQADQNMVRLRDHKQHDERR